MGLLDFVTVSSHTCEMKNEHTLFCYAYLKHNFNGSKAYREIYPGASEPSARALASDLLAKVNVREFVAQLIEQRIEESGIEVGDVVRKLWATATADPNELIEVRRNCCRHCYGADGKYQYTQGEWTAELHRHEADVLRAERDGKRAPRRPDPQGGVGFHKRMPPLPDCEECFGDGVEEVFVKDSRELSPAARELYAGVKTTQHGVEIKTHSRDKAVELLGRHLAMFTDNVDHKNNGKSFEPMQLSDFYAKPKTDTKSSS